MTKGLYHFIRQAWKKPDVKTLRARMVEWRKGNAIEKLEKPLRLDRARALGYKAKKGFVVCRVRVIRGGHKRTRPKKGRKIQNLTIRKNLSVNYRGICEQRAQKKFKNLEVLNSYQVGKDGKHYFYEVILVDPCRNEIKNDKTMNWISSKKNKNRVYRGLTSAEKKSRGLRGKN
ncbi:MAG: 50S ribosomal protein L15e [Nanoarchaeota archaeon]|nr:50S ribosomal protein L15e [Nanoarchaeota archaeon]